MTKVSYKYADFAQKLLRQIVVERMQPGDRLPTEEELVREHGLSRITVRRALCMLEKDGYLSRKRKLGTFVARTVDSVEELHRVRGTVLLAIPALAQTEAEEDHALASVVRGMEDELAQQGFAVHILSVGREETQDRMRLTRLLEHGKVEGVCAVGPCFDRFRDFIGSLPLVNSCTFFPDSLPWVGLNMGDAAYTCVKHLLDHGHRQIATIVGPWVDLRAMAQIGQGHRRAFEEASAPFKRTMLFQAHEGESLTELAREILKSEPPPSAIFAEHWLITRAVLSAARDLHIRVPEDLSLVACGQNNLFVTSPVSISAYIPDNKQVGRCAARVLIDLIDGGAAPSEPQWVPGRFVEQHSVINRPL